MHGAFRHAGAQLGRSVCLHRSSVVLTPGLTEKRHCSSRCRTVRGQAGGHTASREGCCGGQGGECLGWDGRGGRQRACEERRSKTASTSTISSIHCSSCTSSGASRFCSTCRARRWARKGRCLGRGGMGWGTRGGKYGQVVRGGAFCNSSLRGGRCSFSESAAARQGTV